MTNMNARDGWMTMLGEIYEYAASYEIAGGVIICAFVRGG